MTTIKAPVVGYRSWFEPALLVGFRFVQGSKPMIREGYDNFKNAMFYVQRNDSKILVISHKHVDQLRNMPEEKLSAIRAHLKNLVNKYSVGDILLKTDLHFRTLQTKLTPSLNNTIPLLQDEMDFAIEAEVPKGVESDWTSVQIYDIVLHIVARLSARVFLGPELCRNREWLDTSIHYTENLFETVIFLRALPTFVHPFVAHMLPSYWRMKANFTTAKRLITPMVLERRSNEANFASYEKPKDMLQWMMDGAQNDYEKDTATLSHLQLLLSLASIHTTTMACAHSIYDLCAHPEFFEPLREEISSVLSSSDINQKQTLQKLVKVDSLIKESQRVNPPSQLAFNRIVMDKPLQLKDGPTLPAGTHFAMASDAVLHDAAYLPGATQGANTAEFDPFRYSKLREEAVAKGNSEAGNRYQFATTDNSSLHFGHGKYSCPGRFFAANEIKLILARLLLDYEFKYPEGQGRPVNLSADENLYPDPNARVMMRRRQQKA
ncbi:putative cytochrome P450 [Stachybotrys elegans]|uniref:Cytochrome P450 n=1 Tax=Stachybotrys elegans TaxID=80388 RepID=A0A8K0WK11_9HYPO|nr:putative cytochrome P450 [Stachybotrys elegans]